MIDMLKAELEKSRSWMTPDEARQASEKDEKIAQLLIREQELQHDYIQVQAANLEDKFEIGQLRSKQEEMERLELELRKEISKLKKENDKISANYRELLGTLESKPDEMLRNIAFFRQQVDDLENTLATVRKSFRETGAIQETELKAVSDDLVRQRMANENLTKKYEKLKQKARKQIETIEKLKRRTVQLSELITKHEVHFASKMLELAECNQENAALQEEVSGLKKKLDEQKKGDFPTLEDFSSQAAGGGGAERVAALLSQAGGGAVPSGPLDVDKIAAEFGLATGDDGAFQAPGITDNPGQWSSGY